MMATRLAVITLALLASAARIRAAPADADPPADADHPARQHSPPPEPPLLVPWKIGQWASYRMTERTGESTVTLRIIAEDACGFWVELEILDGHHRRQARACVTRTQVLGAAETVVDVQAIAMRQDGQATKIINHDDTSTDHVTLADLEQLLTTEWSGHKGVPREDATTPAGTFITLKETHGARTRWSHPEVPISGIVRELEGDTDLVLLDYGQTTARSPILEDQERLLAEAQQARLRERPHRFWFGVMFGNDLLGTFDDGAWTGSLGVTTGWRMSRHLATLFDITTTQAATYAPDPALYEELKQVVLGLRWFPYDRPAKINRRVVFDTSGVYVQADLGYAALSRGEIGMDSSIVGRGGLAGLRLGVVVGQSREWKLGVELHEHSALLNNDEGLRITLGLHATIELYML